MRYIRYDHCMTTRGFPYGRVKCKQNEPASQLRSLAFTRDASLQSCELEMDSLLGSFKCSFCSKRFSTENGSDSHQRAVHSVKYSQLKPFACPVCPKRFATENDLKHHVENAGKRHKKMTGNTEPSIVKLLLILLMRTNTSVTPKSL